jgi:hypothetical protein
VAYRVIAGPANDTLLFLLAGDPIEGTQNLDELVALDNASSPQAIASTNVSPGVVEIQFANPLITPNSVMVTDGPDTQLWLPDGGLLSETMAIWGIYVADCSNSVPNADYTITFNALDTSAQQAIIDGTALADWSYFGSPTTHPTSKSIDDDGNLTLHWDGDGPNSGVLIICSRGNLIGTANGKLWVPDWAITVD